MIENCTFVNCGILLGDDDDIGNFSTVYNSVLAGVANIGTDPLVDSAGGSNNGFYNCAFSDFGSGAIDDGNSPFQTVGGGSYYLADNTFRGQGTADIDPALLADLAQRTTYPPTNYDAQDLSSLEMLTPQVQRDTNSAPDIGYHYAPIDYLIGGCDLETNLIVAPGTVIAWFNDNDPMNGIPDSITLNDGANLTFNGTAAQPCIFTRNVMVQENGNISWYNDTDWASGAITFNGSGDINLTPQVSAVFAKWTSDNSASPLEDYGSTGAGTFRNCELYNGAMSTYNVQSLSFTNCLFYRFNNNFWTSPNLSYVNCTFYNGCLSMYRSSPVFWLVENSSFDGTVFAWGDSYNGDTNYTLFDYNAYNTNNWSWTNYPYGFPPVYGTLETVGPDDLMVTNYNWQSNWFGNFYLPPDSLLITNGSTNANFLGLYEFTTQTNQIPEGSNVVDIGYHYVATDTNGNPLSTYVPGTPNYIVDSQGNGMDTNGLAYWWELQYLGQIGANEYTDPFGEGFSLLDAYENGIAPNDLGMVNPVMLASWSFNDTNEWLGDQQQLPRVARNISGVPSWETNAVFINSTNIPLPSIATNIGILVVIGADHPLVNTTYLYTPGTSDSGIYSNNWFSTTSENAIGLSADWKIYNYVSGVYENIYENTNDLNSPWPPCAGWTLDLGGIRFGDRIPPTSVSPFVTTNASDLAYSGLQPSGEANFNLRQGTVSFWFRPDWASANAGGTGPGNEGRFIEFGDQGTTNGWWGIVVNSGGTNVYFGTQTNPITTLTTNLVASISWVSNFWHQIVLTYATNTSSLYIDGQPIATNGSGVFCYPALSVQANGFSIGSSTLGTNQAGGTFEDLSSYNYPLDAGTVSTNYNRTFATDGNGDGISDIWEMNYFGAANINTNALDPDGLATFQDYALGLDPISNQIAEPSTSSKYSYSSADWLNAVSGIRNGTIGLDNEGNVQS